MANQKKVSQIKHFTSLGILSVFMGSTLGAVNVLGANIAVIDSGTDFRHPALVDHTWFNPGEIANSGKDDDGDGYIDDINGWNFADNNNEVIDYSLLGTFSPDTEKFFAIQLRIMEGTATEDDMRWMENKRKDEKFIEELQAFGNFVHGTHVSGIASEDTPDALIMAVKLIGGQKPKESDDSESSDESSDSDESMDILGSSRRLLSKSSLGGSTQASYKNKLAGLMDRIALKLTGIDEVRSEAKPKGMLDKILMQGALGMLAGQQVKGFTPVGEYMAVSEMSVANCSFGSGGAQSQMIAQAIANLVLKRELTSEEAVEYGRYFMTQLVQKGSAFTQASPETLFVVAAGNDHADNDVEPVFPANIKGDNSISVAATRGFDSLASFSNFGLKMVEIAAPGVGILSAIPGDSKMVLSGTSQAAPYVTRVAGKVLDANPDLHPRQIKSILMNTVDKKSFLTGVVVSGGIVNERRAVEAGLLSRSMTVRAAIASALRKVGDIQPDFTESNLMFGSLGELGQGITRAFGFFVDQPKVEQARSPFADGMPLPLPLAPVFDI